MTKKTTGYLIRRENIREIDENVIFFTKDWGMISTLSFGSRSAKSRRSRALAERDCLEIIVEMKKGVFYLVELTILEKHGFLRDVKNFHLFLNTLSIIEKTLPMGTVDQLLFDLIRVSSNEDYYRDVGEQEELILNLGILHVHGLFPHFQACEICGQTCSVNYYFLPGKKNFIGEECRRNASSILLADDDVIWLTKYYYHFRLTREWLLSMKNVKLNLNLRVLIMMTRHCLSTGT